MVDPISVGIMKAAGAAIGRVAVSFGVGKWNEMRLQGSLGEPEPRELSTWEIRKIKSLTSEQLSAIKSLLDRPEFETLLVRHVVATMADKSVDNGPTATSEISNLVRLYVKTDNETSALVARAVFDHVSAIVDIYLGEYAASGALSKDFDRAIASAGIVARMMSQRHVSVLESILELEPVRKFVDNLKSQVLSIHGRMQIADSVTLRYAPFEDLFVPSELFDESNSSVDLRSVMKRNRRLVVKGDPGGGKSTFAAKIALGLADNSSEWTADLSAPFLLILRQFAQDMVAQHRSVLQQLQLLANSP